MDKGYSLAEATAIISRQCNEKSISSGFVSECLRELRGYERLFPSDRFTISEITMIGMYASELHGHHERVKITEWTKAHNFEKPKGLARIQALVETVQKKEVRQQSTAADDKKLEKMIERKIAGAVETAVRKVLQEKAKPVALLPESSTRDSDPVILELHRKVNAFVFAENISAKSTWTSLQSEFEGRNGIKVVRFGGQSFPQWLRSEGYLNIFMDQLQGFLDDLHDSVNRQPRLVK